MKNLHILQQESIDEGRLQVRVRQKNMGTPVADARVSVSYSGDPQGKIEETDTNESGSIEAVEIATPPLEYSMSPSESQPYSEVTVTVSANGYRNITVSGVEVMPDRLSIQDIELEVLDAPGNDVDNIVIPAHTLYGDYPAKIPEPEIMPVAETGEIVLNRVVIPEYVIVHDGAPSDSTAANYYVRYKDYIKNVASSEIYATWPDATIRANVLAIMSFTLNRIYTEFYRGKGYNFNITSSTAYDHKFIYGRNIYDNISLIVNEMFENYLSSNMYEYKDKMAKRDFDDLIKDAITGAHGKNAKAITALLDVDTLMQSKNQKEDIAAAIKKLTEAEDSKILFGEPEPQARGGGSPIGRIGDDSHPNTTDSISSALKEYYKK